jgi:hypothetical protein
MVVQVDRSILPKTTPANPGPMVAFHTLVIAILGLATVRLHSDALMNAAAQQS